MYIFKLLIQIQISLNNNNNNNNNNKFPSPERSLPVCIHANDPIQNLLGKQIQLLCLIPKRSTVVPAWIKSCAGAVQMELLGAVFVPDQKGVRHSVNGVCKKHVQVTDFFTNDQPAWSILGIQMNLGVKQALR